MHKICVIIPSFNRKSYLLEVLSDLRQQTGTGFSISTFVVIDGSTDGSFEEVDRFFPDVTIVPGSGDWFYTKCINEGAKAAESHNPDFLLLLNDDISIKHNYIQSLLNDFNATEGNCVMGSLSVTMEDQPRVTFAGIKDITWWRLKWQNRIPAMSSVELESLSGVHPSKVLPGRGMFISYQLFNELNGFNEELPQYGSDDDFCLRAAEKGNPVVVNYNAVVYSHHKLTGTGNKVHRNSLIDILKAFKNKYSTLYLPKTAYMVKRHGNRMMLPVTLSIVVVASLLSTLKWRS